MASDVSINWLTAWHRDGPWLVFEIDPEVENPLVPAREFTDVTALRTYLDDRIGIVNLYFIPNKVLPGTIRTTPKKDAITYLHALYVDLDLPKTGERSAPTEDNFAYLLQRIYALSPQPTAIVFSGGGFQAFWMFPEPLPAAEYLDRVEAASKAIGKSLKSDAVQNINRLMRLPGTVNLPNAAKRQRKRVPAESTLVESDWSRTWSFADPIPTLPDGYWDDDPSDANRPRVIGDLPQKLARLIKTGDASAYGDDRSRVVWAVVHQLVRRGWDTDDIIPILTSEAYGVSQHCLAQKNPIDYARRQIAKAKQEQIADWARTTTGAIDGMAPRNLRKALSELGVTLKYDAFSAREFYINGSGGPKLFDDALEAGIRVDIHDKFGFAPGRDALRDVTVTMARASSFHPVIEYLNSLTWDGTPRLDTWLIRLAGAKDEPYTRAVSRLTLIAAVRRVRQPGCKFDEMLVLINPDQGTNKSSALAVLAVKPEWFTDSLPLHANNQQTIEALAGKWIVECAELQGMRQSDVETLKAFLSRQADRARMAYGHHPVTAPRQCVFFATTNSDAFLRDRTNRRFWPVRVGRVDADALGSEVEQLWAEAAYAESQGESIRLHPDLWPAAAERQEEARVGEVWTEILIEALGGMTGRLAVIDAWRIIGPNEQQRNAFDGAKLVECMREIGWERDIKKFGKLTMRCFVKGTEEDRRKIVHVHRDPIDKSLSVSGGGEPEEGSGEPEEGGEHYQQPHIVEPTKLDDNEVPF